MLMNKSCMFDYMPHDRGLYGLYYPELVYALNIDLRCAITNVLCLCDIFIILNTHSA